MQYPTKRRGPRNEMLDRDVSPGAFVAAYDPNKKEANKQIPLLKSRIRRQIQFKEVISP